MSSLVCETRPQVQHPTWRSSLSVYIWLITFGLSGLVDPASSYATVGLVLRSIWPPKPRSYIKLFFFRKEKIGSNFTDVQGVLYQKIFGDTLEKIQDLLKYYKNNVYCIWRRMYIYDNISLNSS